MSGKQQQSSSSNSRDADPVSVECSGSDDIFQFELHPGLSRSVVELSHFSAIFYKLFGWITLANFFHCHAVSEKNGQRWRLAPPPLRLAAWDSCNCDQYELR